MMTGLKGRWQVKQACSQPPLWITSPLTCQRRQPLQNPLKYRCVCCQQLLVYQQPPLNCNFLQVTGKCEALFDFKAENSGELSFRTGDTIVTLEWVNEEWISGRLGDQEGMFPVAFVKVLKELPKPAANKENTNKGT